MRVRLEFERNNPDLYVMRARLNQLTNQMTASYHDVNQALALDPDHKVRPRKESVSPDFGRFESF